MNSLSQLLFIETFVLGAAFIAAIYHLVLFIQQRDKFLLFYSFYLFSLSSYIFFKLTTDNYDPFQPTNNIAHYIIEEVLQLFMVTIYTTFAAVTLEVNSSKGIVRILWFVFIIIAALSIFHHVSKASFDHPNTKSYIDYAISRYSIISTAFIALVCVWQIRTTPFQRTIIIGSFVYAFSGLFSALSFTINFNIFGLSGVEPYLLGCLIDIIIFSTAFGYRIKKISEEKNLLLLTQIEAQNELLNERKRISNELHDDLGSGLSTIRFLSEMAKSEKSADQSKIKLEKIAEMSNDLVDNMRQIVWSMNTAENTLQNLINDLKKYANDYLETNMINVEFEIKDKIPVRLIQSEIRRNIFLVVKESLHNIVKHANATNVNFKVQVNSKVEISISDNGTGFKKSENHNSGNGLTNMKRRMEACNGTFFIESKDNTKVVFSF